MAATGQMQHITSAGVRGRFYRLLETSQSLVWPMELCGEPFPSDQALETYPFAGMSPAMREWIGKRAAKQLSEKKIEVRNRKFESTIAVPVDDLRRDKTGQLDMRLNELVIRSRTHWASLLSTLIAAGTGTTMGSAYDGKAFFSASHSEGKSGTLRNTVTKTQVPSLDVTTTTAPTPDEFSSAIMDVIDYFLEFKDDQGEPLNEDAMEFRVMVPRALSGTAKKSVRANFLSTGSGVRDNLIIENPDFNVRVITNTRLSWTDSFAVFRVDGNTRPFIMQEELGPVWSQKAEGSDFEHDNDAHEYGVKVQRNVAFGQWQHAIYATFG